MSTLQLDEPIYDIAGRNVRQITKEEFKPELVGHLNKLGIAFGKNKTAEANNIYTMKEAMYPSQPQVAMDSLQPLYVTTPNTLPLGQFFTNILPNFVETLTTPLMIDQILGIRTIGAFEDTQIAQGIVELTGNPQPYSDHTNTPLASYNVEFAARSVNRFELGLRVGYLQDKIASRINLNEAQRKRNAVIKSLNVLRNKIGFLGYNNGFNNSYGFLNDPLSLPYNNVAQGAANSTQWARKTTLEIINDIIQMVQGIRTQSGDNIKPESAEMTLVVATAVIDYLTKPTELGYSIKQWMAENYPGIRVVSAVELDGANGGLNVAYLFAQTIDGEEVPTYQNLVQNKFLMIGAKKDTKFYEEVYANAFAGILIAIPFGSYRITGI